jgi:hypothetical protein
MRCASETVGSTVTASASIAKPPMTLTSFFIFLSSSTKALSQLQKA